MDGAVEEAMEDMEGVGPTEVVVDPTEDGLEVVVDPTEEEAEAMEEVVEKAMEEEADGEVVEADTEVVEATAVGVKRH